MNRNRKVTRATLKTDENGRNYQSSRNYDVEEVLPPKSRRNPFKIENNATDRSCSYAPEQKDFSQYTEVDGTDQYQSLLLQQYGFDPIFPETINQLKELRKVLCTPKVDDSSQYVTPGEEVNHQYAETVDESNWLKVEDTDDIDDIIKEYPVSTRICPEVSVSEVKNIKISDVPRIKIIAEKFSKYKKDNVELRRLDEKVVCIEYDIFEENINDPIQKMRAYFSIKSGNYKDTIISSLPSKVKHEFNISEVDLRKLNDKELEIIDGKVAANKPYIEDLIRVLKRKQAINMKKNTSTLDLRALYEMAKNNRPALDDNFSDTNLLSKAELDEIKELILKKCTSSMYGINKKSIKPEISSTDINFYRNVNVVSQSIFVELLKNQSGYL